MAKGAGCGVLIVKAEVMLRGMADLVQHPQAAITPRRHGQN